jgi:hypothetical protein
VTAQAATRLELLQSIRLHRPRCWLLGHMDVSMSFRRGAAILSFKPYFAAAKAYVESPERRVYERIQYRFSRMPSRYLPGVNGRSRCAPTLSPPSSTFLTRALSIAIERGEAPRPTAMRKAEAKSFEPVWSAETVADSVRRRHALRSEPSRPGARLEKFVAGPKLSSSWASHMFVDHYYGCLLLQGSLWLSAKLGLPRYSAPAACKASLRPGRILLESAWR